LIEAEIVIIGAGTAGTYLSWLLAKNGVDVHLIEKDQRNEVGKRLDVIHFESDRIKKAGLPPFIPGDPDCIEIRNESIIVPPDFSTEIRVRALQTIVRLTPFLVKMFGILEECGTNLHFDTTFKELVYKEGRIVGIKAIKDNKTIEFRSKLVVDASGTKAVVRTSLPEDYGIETFDLGSNDVMHVLLQYIKWKNPNKPHPENDTGYNYWLLWFGPSFEDDGAILGVGQPGSFENARLAREDFLDLIDLPPYEIVKKEKGITPYRRPPYSLVADGFLCIGDAAAITYPFSGHGVTATWMLCLIAAEVIKDNFKEDSYLNRDNLWDINVKYFRNQGAKFAALLTQLSGILSFTKKEWSYFLKSGLIYKTGKDEEIPEPNKEYEEEMSLKDMLGFLSKIIKGLLTRKLSLKHIRKLLRANNLANKIHSHYEKYPNDHAQFKSWVKEAEDLWAQKEPAVKKLSNVEITYH
jgi:flavin-dependent dehydrogenase